MKVRTGFVSNSSSSSFCILGICDSDLAKEMLSKMGLSWKDDSSYGCAESKDIKFFGGYEGPDFVGVDAETYLQKEGISAAKKKVAAVFKEKLGFDVPLNDIGFHWRSAKRQ